MFTGIIDHTGRIAAIEKTPQGLRFTITTQFQELVLGESIAVDGVCLTVTDLQEQVFCCDVSPETLALTTLGQYKKDSEVNLERSLSVGDRMGGHYVTGHVDRSAQVALIQTHDEYIEIQFSGFTTEQLKYLIPKGSVTVNGVSLTINAVENVTIPKLSVMLIPHTLEITNLSKLAVGSNINIEFDYYAKVIAHQLALQTQSLGATHVS
jgi:riboflavin synthase